MNYDLEKIANQFQVPGDYVSAKSCGTGHINDTFAVTFNQDGRDVRYVLQRINHAVFKDPLGLMENIVRVTEHIRSKLLQRNVEDISRRVLRVFNAKDGKDHYKDDEGNFWRAMNFVEGARTYDVLESTGQAYEAAKAFGLFQSLLADLPEPALHDTIPDFHNGPKRYSAFIKALEADRCGRAVTAKKEIAFVKENGGIFNVLPELVEAGKIPVRTTHNDAKINNVTLDNETGEGICVFDLDTVMPGLSLYDFGDLVRSTVCQAREDEKDLSRIEIIMPNFEALVKGYMTTAKEFLNQHEIDNLVLGGKMITLIMGTRFLTDYLDGDNYYKIDYPDHNLDRCRTQLRLVELMLEREDEMNELVAKMSDR
ncbi:MAG TPA: aminoglycoside phosphotransferase family protein [Phycisphaerales bacterium]|nr:aminoglycoside phosphotransferase family protein [Phycisphaerales bacterium]